MTGSEFVATLASGAALGALVSGLVQFLMASKQRAWDREDARRERRRTVYEGYLRHIMTLSTRFITDWIEKGNGWDFAEKSRLTFENLRVDMMLVASDDVREGLNEVENAIYQWRTSMADMEHEDGVVIWEVLDREWDARVMPAVRRVASTMSDELEA